MSHHISDFCHNNFSCSSYGSASEIFGLPVNRDLSKSIYFYKRKVEQTFAKSLIKFELYVRLLPC